MGDAKEGSEVEEGESAAEAREKTYIKMLKGEVKVFTDSSERR